MPAFADPFLLVSTVLLVWLCPMVQSTTTYLLGRLGENLGAQPVAEHVPHYDNREHYMRLRLRSRREAGRCGRVQQWPHALPIRRAAGSYVGPAKRLKRARRRARRLVGPPSPLSSESTTPTHRIQTYMSKLAGEVHAHFEVQAMLEDVHALGVEPDQSTPAVDLDQTLVDVNMDDLATPTSWRNPNSPCYADIRCQVRQQFLKLTVQRILVLALLVVATLPMAVVSMPLVAGGVQPLVDEAGAAAFLGA